MLFRTSTHLVLALAGASLSFACSASTTDGVDGSGGADATGGGNVIATGGSSTGSGGATASGGTGGTSTSTGGTPAGSDPCDTATICDDFEDGIDPGWGIQPDSNPAPVTDTTKGANGSATSLKITGTSNQAFITLPVPSQSFYVRAYVNFEKSTDEMTGHGWFIVGADNVTSGAGAQMRAGSSGNHGDGNQLDFNVYGGGCSGEPTQYSNGASDGAAGWNNTPYAQVKFDHDTWYCVEAFFNGTGDEFQYWIDDVEVPGLHVTEATMCSNWSPTYTHIKFGAGANSNLGDIWYDDVAVSTTRIGCPAK